MRTKDFAIQAIARENLTGAFAAEASGRLAAQTLSAISSEGGSGGIPGNTRARKVSGIREGVGAEPPGSPSLEIKTGRNATPVSPYGVPPSGGKAPDAEGGRLISQKQSEISSEGASGSIPGGLGARKASGIREGTGAELPGSPSLEIEIGADCFHCHGGPLFQSQNFANNGLDSEFGDSGRQLVTGREGDKGRFAVPSLRNVEVTGPNQ